VFIFEKHSTPGAGYTGAVSLKCSFCLQHWIDIFVRLDLRGSAPLLHITPLTTARKYITRVDPTSIIPTKFEVDMTIRCRVIAFLSADTAHDLVTVTFDLLTWTAVLPGHMANLATKYEDPTHIRFWVMSYNVYHWLPLTMRTRPLCMRRIMWPVRVKNNYIFGIPDPDMLSVVCLSVPCR